MKKTIILLFILLFTAGMLFGLDYTIELTDSYGDGWNDGSIDVLVNSSVVLNDLTLSSGSGPESHTFSVVGGDEITTAYTAGGWAYENEYQIKDETGAVVAEDGQDGEPAAGGVSYTVPVAGAPGAPTTPSPADGTTNVTVTANLGWTYGADTDSADIYFSTTESDVTNKETSARVLNNTTNTTYDPVTMVNGSTYYWRVVAKNSAGSTTDGSVWSFTTACATVTSLDEDFEGGIFPSCWAQDGADDFDWTVATGSTSSTNTGPTAAHGGSYYIYTQAWPGNSGDQAIIYSPPVDLTSFTAPCLNFWNHMYGAGMDPDGTIDVSISTNNGTSYSSIWSQSGNQGDQWNHALVDLSTYANNTVILRFTGTISSSLTIYQNDFALDDILIEEAPDYPAPTSLSATNIGVNSADLDWTENGTATVWDIEWGPAGFTQGTGTIINDISNKPYSLSGLIIDSTYDFYVRTDDGAASSWSYNKGTFTTHDGVAVNPTPGNNAEDIDKTATTLDWEDIIDATKYYVTIGTSSGGNSLADSADAGATSEYTYSFNWPVGTTIYWTVYTQCDDGTGATTIVTGTEWNFTTYLDPNPQYVQDGLDEDFEDEFPPFGWTNIAVSNDAIWELSESGYISSHCVNFDDPEEEGSGDLITPRLDLTASNNDALYFWIENRHGLDWWTPNECQVYISTDGKISWDLLATYDTEITYFQEEVIQLESGIDQTDNTYIKFRGIDKWADHLKIDNVIGPQIWMGANNVLTGTYSGGQGVWYDPAQISTTDDLIELSNTPDDWDVFICQTNDISFNSDETQVDWDGDGSANWDTDDQKGFSPIGNLPTKFTGAYDGQGYTIDNFFIDRPTENAVALFGQVEEADISNLGLTNVNITGKDFVGAIIGGNLSNSTALSTFSTGSVSGESWVGGLVGLNDGSATISKSYNESTVNGVDFVGGIAGANLYNNSRSIIDQCYNVGNVDGDWCVGGITGDIYRSTIENTYNRGNIDGGTVGGLIGRSQSDFSWSSIISNCYNTGYVTGSSTGGLIGNASDTDVRNCFWDTETSGQSSSSGGGDGKTTAEMQTVDIYAYAGWNFWTPIWEIHSSLNGGYPYLEWEYNDFPAGEPIDVGDGTTVNANANLNYAADQTIPEIPNGSFTPDNEFVLTGSGIVDITITTSSMFGAYYQGGIWNTEENDGGTIFFDDIDFDARGDVPIIIGDDNPLPVTLSTFNATYNNEVLTINWATESEENNAGWNIYRGTEEDALENDVVIQINDQLIAGAGTTNNITEYSFIDEQPIQAGETYWYWLEDISSEGETVIHSPTSLSIPIGDSPEIPLETGLHQNYPNPFNPSTTISFTLDTESTEKVEIEIFNLKGQKIRTYPVILSGAEGSPSYHSIIWDGKDENGKAVSSGVYYYKLNAGKYSETKKMLMIK